MSRIVKHITGDIDVILLTDGIGSFPAEVFFRWRGMQVVTITSDQQKRKY